MWHHKSTYGFNIKLQKYRIQWNHHLRSLLYFAQVWWLQFMGSQSLHDWAHTHTHDSTWLSYFRILKMNIFREQDGGGVGGRGAGLSPRIHQEYTFRHRTAWRTPAESRQEHLNCGKEFIEPRKTKTKELAGKTGALVGLDLPSVGKGTGAGVWSPYRGHCLSQRRNI